MRLRLSLLVLLVAAVPATPALAGGDHKKPFGVTLSPASTHAGATANGFKVTITNKAKSHRLNYADVTVPAAMAIAGAPSIDRPGTVTVSGNVISLRNVGLHPGKSVTVTLGVRMPCAAGSYAWAVTAKDFGPLSGSLTTTVGGSCALRFVAQPASAERNTQIRAEEFRPDSAQLVSVEAVDGSPAPQRLTWFSGTIDLRLVQDGPGVLTPSPASSAAVAGLASFSDLAIDASGNYNLEATTAAAGFTPDVSKDFQIIGVVEPCDATSCTAELAGTTSTSTLTGAPGASTGFALLSFKLGPEPVCAGYTPASADWYEFALTAERDKTITATYTKAAIKAFGKPVKSLQICFAAPAKFATKTGTAQPFDYDGDPANGAEGFVGLLPDCKYKPSTPCVLKRESTGHHHHRSSSSSSGGGGAIVKFFVPASWGDPRYRG